MKRDFDALTSETFDLIVVGGGIMGTGIARDAALRGINTLLLEKNDFASGTTSRSSRLIHGGLWGGDRLTLLGTKDEGSTHTQIASQLFQNGQHLFILPPSSAPLASCEASSPCPSP